MEVIDQQEVHDTGRSLENVLAEGYTFNIGDFINRGFKIFGSDAGSFIGFVLLHAVIGFVISLLPFISLIGSLLVSPALAAGYYTYMAAGDKGGMRTFGNFFDGFKGPVWGQLVLANLIISIFLLVLGGIVAIPLFMGVGLSFVQELASMGSNPGQDEIEAMVQMLLGGGFFLWILIIVLFTTLLATLWILTPLFIVFRNLSFWDAMEASRKVVMKNYIKFFLLVIVLGLLTILGALLCFIGLIVAIPVLYLVVYAAFKHIFSDESRPIHSGI